MHSYFKAISRLITASLSYREPAGSELKPPAPKPSDAVPLGGPGAFGVQHQRNVGITGCW